MALHFADIPRDDRGEWITLIQGDLYPDIIAPASLLYAPVVERFGSLLYSEASAIDLYRAVLREHRAIRGKMMAVFRRYFTDISTENLGKINQSENIIRHHGSTFRDITEARIKFAERPIPDEALMAILYLNAQRGKTGYSLTQLFFEWFESQFSDVFRVYGPKGGGTDLNLHLELDEYKKATKADILIRSKDGAPLVVGFARYDAHRGGSQEDDRIKGNNDNLTDIMEYSERLGHVLRVLFVNDGPGLTAGSMWADYAELERRWAPHVVVATLRMLPQLVTADWISGG